MICESQFKCKNCHDDFKCFMNCDRYLYQIEEGIQNNFEMEDKNERVNID